MSHNTILIIFFSLLFLWCLFNKPESEIEIEEDEPFHIPEDKPEVEYFYHPTTGYKGTKSEMDTYISNRERKWKNGEKYSR